MFLDLREDLAGTVIQESLELVSTPSVLSPAGWAGWRLVILLTGAMGELKGNPLFIIANKKLSAKTALNRYFFGS